jgi:pimeloyl-ACP methyl ester carboxylesterase
VEGAAVVLEAAFVTRVLYVHGLESGPTGHKARLLAEAGFEVSAVQMPFGRRHALREPLVAVWALSSLSLVGFAAWSTAPWLVTVALVAGATSFPVVRLFVTRRVFSRSLEVQRRHLAATPVDVVVGSSFGGAIAVELLRAGDWRGPTVLLCPASALVSRRSGWPPHPGFDGMSPDATAQVLVVHGTRDETVPLEDSRRLVARTSARLVTVEDDHRLSATANAASLHAWVESVRSPPTA